MHNNPVNRSLVSSPADWPWSSWRFFNLNARSILEMDRLGMDRPEAELARGTQAESDPRGKVWCAGINRQEAEGENPSRGRSSDPLGPEFCARGVVRCPAKRKQGNRWAGY